MAGPRIFYTIYARRPSDFAVVEEEHNDEARAYENARHYQANGYDVTVHRCVKELIAKWKQEARR